jgi:hypothetical protein
VEARPYVLAVDPGLMSGLAVVEREGPRLVYSAELGWEDLDDQVNAWLHHYGPGQVNVAAERFTITVATGKKSQATWSLECIGMLRSWSRSRGQGAVALYSPADAKAMFDNDTLHRLGLWHKGGEGHARDAIRHALMCLVATQWRDSRLLQES